MLDAHVAQAWSVTAISSGVPLLEPLGYVPPAAFERAFYDHQAMRRNRRCSRNELSGEPGVVQVGY